MLKRRPVDPFCRKGLFCTGLLKTFSLPPDSCPLVLSGRKDLPAAQSLAGTGPASTSYSASTAMSPVWICSRFIRRTGISRSMNRRATRFLRGLAGALPQEQMADDDRDRRIDQPPAGQIHVGGGLRLDELDGLQDPLLGVQEFLLQFDQERIAVFLHVPLVGPGLEGPGASRPARPPRPATGWCLHRSS